MVRFLFRIVQKIELDLATTRRFRQDTGFDMRRKDQVTWCDSKSKNLKVEGASDLCVSVTHRILT